jgi:ABC-type ATPase with predicted acetyltransferase domain
LVKQTLPLANAKVVEVLAVMARYNPFFERAGMIKVDYRREETAIDKKINAYLKERNFYAQFAKSKTYCQNYFSQLNAEDKQTLTGYLKEFVEQPFIKTKNVTPELLGKTQHSKANYLY